MLGLTVFWKRVKIMISFRHLSTYALNSRINAERMERNGNFKNHRAKHRLRKIIQKKPERRGKKKKNQ